VVGSEAQTLDGHINHELSQVDSLEEASQTDSTVFAGFAEWPASLEGLVLDEFLKYWSRWLA